MSAAPARPVQATAPEGDEHDMHGRARGLR